MRLGPPTSGIDLHSSIAPSRGGSISMRSNGPRRASQSSVISKRLATANCVLCARPFFSAFSSARSTSCWLPSMPSTVAPKRAIGRVKLPRPQNMSAMRSPGCGSSSLMARSTITRLICGLTWVNSVGLNGMTTPNSGKL